MDKNNRQTFKTEFRAMGTTVSADIVLEKTKEDSARKAFREIRTIFEKNEKIFSRFRPDSELSKINQNLGKEIRVSPEMLEVLELCLKFNKISEGYFDPRVIENLERIGYDKDFKSHDFNDRSGKEIFLEKIEGGLEDDLIIDARMRAVTIKKRIDTTGIAKGYTVDEAANYLSEKGFQNFIVDAGGDMLAQGVNDEGEDWRIGIEGLEDDRLMLKLKNEGIATSGISRKRWTIGGRKFHHLVNPKDPENFSYEIKTVTVIAEKTVEADGRAKVLVLMGKEKGLEFADRHDLKALFLDYKGNIYLSRRMKENILS